MYMYACMCETRDQAKSISLCCAEGTEDQILQLYFKNRVVEPSRSELFPSSHRIRRCFQSQEMQPLQLKNSIRLTIQTVHRLVTANCINLIQGCPLSIQSH